MDESYIAVKMAVDSAGKMDLIYLTRNPPLCGGLRVKIEKSPRPLKGRGFLFFFGCKMQLRCILQPKNS